MRILHVIPSLDPADGGPPAVAQRLGAAQAALGAEVGLIYWKRPGAEERIAQSLADTPGADRLRLHAAPAPSGWRRVAPGTQSELGAQIMGADVDIAHLHGVWTPVLAAAARRCARAGVRYCVAPHGMLDPWCLGQKRLKKRLALALLWRRILNGATFIHALNRDEADLMAPLGLTAPTRVIPNGIFIEEFASLPPPGAFRSARPQLGEAPYVLFLGRLHQKKGLDLLAPAFARALRSVPDARLVVAGPDGGARAPFERQVRDLKIDGNVDVVGPIYGAAKLAALRDAACFCLPSRQEGFSIAITEALACGVPCVVSADCHYPEVAEAGAGRVTSLDPGEIGDALAEVLSDPDAGARMGKVGADLVRQRFTWPRIAAQTLDAYQQLKEPRAQARG